MTAEGEWTGSAAWAERQSAIGAYVSWLRGEVDVPAAPDAYCGHGGWLYVCVEHPAGGAKCGQCMRRHLAVRRSGHGRWADCGVCGSRPAVSCELVWQYPGPLSPVGLVGVDRCAAHVARYHGWLPDPGVPSLQDPDHDRVSVSSIVARLCSAVGIGAAGAAEIGR